MHRTGIADLPLHGGRAPAWLFGRMTRLASAVVLAMREDMAPTTLLGHLSDPYWFQAFGCLLGFDWHSSGLTTTVCGALKEGLRDLESEIGLFVVGGKGATSRRTPAEIARAAETLGRDFSALAHASRLAAKVDSAALQDGYQLYHHTFIFTPAADWAVIQQGMCPTTRYARRYHWLGASVSSFVSEPHAAIVGERREHVVLNLVAREGDAHRTAIAHAVRRERPETILDAVRRLRLPARHSIEESFEQLLALPGVGAKTLRALSLAAEIMYGVPGSFRDPAVYAFAHGGKDGHPYPVDRETYDTTIGYLETAVRHSRLGERDRLDALRRLGSLERDTRAFPRG
jgi:uncharacterized protein